MSPKPDVRASLLGSKTAKDAIHNQRSKTILEIPLDRLVPFRGQSRRYFDQAAIDTLAQSMKKHGQLTPLLVWKDDSEQYEVLAGERRWRALTALNRKVALADVLSGISFEQAQEIALVDNLQRENLNRFEEVKGKLDLIARRLNLTAEEARAEVLRLRNGTSDNAEHLNVVQDVLSMAGNETLNSFVSNGFPVLDLPPVLREPIEAGRLHPSKALVIRGAPEAHHAALVEETIRDGLTRQQLLERVRSLHTPKTKTYRTTADVVRSLLTPARVKTLDTAKQAELEGLLTKVRDLLQ
ncbi:ParB/RepB/Spo0J family partition protein [Deinococcus soli (ex Cha et al. 2016)]|uniref:ParB family chromosome partitioning protein n=2 Tax=Deinococcus soli (ex Cha et al. 2016) TaxID=1309411 RepID=A0ACC6KG74_9DEIO|nr:ParB/RepB/Spo0J family partition protein [Deinococcus soli (ex Cha et al. 2016)]MDR6218452.1 ParB family chromosome partitioning protein [Deinococcus soli (ex Cha et al. 2016)]MDR6329192.1 ParB family chromosome partitioning protein [Deinococcus soli (ex Cha et al. 2016)]MDR6751465.1 ParB family chromosome partitioning protein [Deinococcus soli (ex Cha et al. 2016)]